MGVANHCDEVAGEALLPSVRNSSCLAVYNISRLKRLELVSGALRLRIEDELCVDIYPTYAWLHMLRFL